MEILCSVSVIFLNWFSFLYSQLRILNNLVRSLVGRLYSLALGQTLAPMCEAGCKSSLFPYFNQLVKKKKASTSLDNHITPIKLQTCLNEVPDLLLKRQHKKELLWDALQKRGERGECGATITRNPEESIAVLLVHTTTNWFTNEKEGWKTTTCLL